jgi:hypothetical protein
LVQPLGAQIVTVVQAIGALIGTLLPI